MSEKKTARAQKNNQAAWNKRNNNGQRMAEAQNTIKAKQTVKRHAPISF